jgi:V8-like Glu-specific endopeptidase
MFLPSFEWLEARKVFSLTPVPPNPPRPLTAVVKIEGTFPDGQTYVGSGFLVDSYHVLTAGHLVYDFDDGGLATSITVIPDLYGTSEPFGEATMINERTTPTWQAFSAAHPDLTGSDAQDIGLVTLNRQIGNETGWMTYGYSNELTTYAPGAVFDTAGYPADPASGYDGLHMAYSSGPIVGLSPDKGAIGYDQSDITTYGGQSGRPVWASSTGMVSGVVTGGEIPSAVGSIRLATSSGGGLSTHVDRPDVALEEGNHLDRRRLRSGAKAGLRDEAASVRCARIGGQARGRAGRDGPEGTLDQSRRLRSQGAHGEDLPGQALQGDGQGHRLSRPGGCQRRGQHSILLLGRSLKNALPE